MPITTTPSGGPQGEFSTYTPIYAQTLSSNAANVTFSNIPTTYTDLVLVVSGQVSSAVSLACQINGNTSTNYSATELYGDGTNAGSARNSAENQITVSSIVAQIASGSQWVSTLHFQNYSNATTYKTVLARTSAPGTITTETIGLWRSLSPVTSIKFMGYANSSGFTSGTSFTLYGIKAATAQFTPTKAFGGDVIVSDGTYAYHAFLNTARFTATQTLSCDILVVAGGGGGGGSIGGGGGAGGLLTFTSQSVSASTSTVTVGAGGVAGGSSIDGSSGTNSQFAALTASVGGGRGGTRGATIAGASGGSGGGGTGGGAGGSATSSQGYAGASVSGDVAPAYAGAGGGGAGGAGGGVTSTTGGNGGVGVYSTLTDAIGAATGAGQLVSSHYYFAGGGAGGTDNPTGGGGTPGTAGYGGGGAASPSRSYSATPGSAFTGGGGGGNSNGSGTVAGNGGSGIVIVRYAL